MLYYIGRIFQLIGIVAMPSAMWITEFEHSERGAIAVFSASALVFLIGFFLTRAAKK